MIRRAACFLIFGLVILSARQGLATIAVSNQTGNISCTAVTTCTLTLGSTPTNGDALVVSFRLSTQIGAPSVTDDGGNTYTQAWTIAHGTGETYQFYTCNVSGSAASYKIVVHSGTSTNIRETAVELSSQATASCLDKTSTNTGTSSGTTIDTGATGTLAQSSEALIVACGLASNDTFTLGSGFSNLTVSPSSGGNQVQGQEDKIVAVTTTSTPTMVTAANQLSWGCGVGTYKDVTGGATATDGSSMSTMGMGSR